MNSARNKILITLLIAIAIATILLIYYSPSSKENKNVLLISIDTCRADYLSCYGYEKNTTPNLDELAKHSLLFKNVTTQVPMTLPAHCSMLTGTIPPYHQVHDNYKAALAPENLTLAETLKQQGYKTAAVISNYVLNAKFGTNQGFDTYLDQYTELKDDLDNGRTAQQVNNLAFQWLAQSDNEKFFLFLHYFDPHLPYYPPKPFDSAYPDSPYAGEIAYSDHCIGKLFEKLKKMDLYESSLIIVTSDHGELLTEHGESEHGYFLYEAAIKVPLIIKPPHAKNPKTIENPVALIDILPTICSLLEIPVPQNIHGRDLTILLEQPPNTKEDKRYIYCESFLPAQYQCNPLLGMVTQQYKYIHTTRPELYDILQDPQETKNLVDENPKLAHLFAENLNLTLEKHSRQTEQKNLTLDPQTRQRLESLGYIDTGAKYEAYEFDKNKYDPKDFIEFHERRKKFNIHMVRKQYAQAKTAGEKILTQDASDPQLCYKMAAISSMLGDIPASERYYSMVTHLDPTWSEAHYKLADIYIKQGKLDRAITHYKKALEIMPDWTQAKEKLQMLKERKQKFQNAVQKLTNALQQNPNQPRLHSNLGTIYYQNANLDRAIHHWQIALKLNPNQPTVLNNLAIVKLTHPNLASRNPRHALSMAKKACQLVDYKQSHFLGTLAAAYAATGNFNDAVKTAQNALNLAKQQNNQPLIIELAKKLQSYKKQKP